MKRTLALMTLVSVMLAQTAVSAAPAAATATPTVPATTTPTPTPTATTVAAPAAQDMVKVNGVEMTREQARLVIIANVRNHTQMTPEEMVAYIASLEAEANVAEVTPNTLPVGIK